MLETQQIEATEKKVGSIQLTVASIQINSQETYDRTVQLLQTVREMKADPIVTESREVADAAHKAHTKAQDLWKKFWNPLDAMETSLKNKIFEWDRKKKAEEAERNRKAEEERQAKIRAEEARIAAEAKKKSDEAAANAKRQAAKEGLSKRAQQQAAETAAEAARDMVQQVGTERIQQLEAAPLPATKPSYERSSAVSTRQNWQWVFSGATQQERLRGVYALVVHVAANPDDLYLLEPEKLIETHPALNRMAIAQKTMCKLPGGRAIDKGSVAL